MIQTIHITIIIGGGLTKISKKGIIAVSQGTTPRRYVDLLASLMDLTGGSGNKGILSFM